MDAFLRRVLARREMEQAAQEDPIEPTQHVEALGRQLARLRLEGWTWPQIVKVLDGEQVDQDEEVAA